MSLFPAPFTSGTFTDGEQVDNTKLYTRVLAWLNDFLALVLGYGTGFIDDDKDSGNVTLGSTSPHAGLAKVSYTVPTGGRRIRIEAQAQIVQNTSSNSHYTVQAGYNTGGTVTIGSFTGVGYPADTCSTVLGGSGTTSAFTAGTAFLAAGTYTFYAAVTRVTNGDPADIASDFYVAIYDVGGA